MAILRSTVILDSKGGQDKDEARNVWHFETSGLITDDNMNAASAGLAALYRHIGDRFGSSVSRVSQAHRIEHAQVTQGGAGEEDDQVSKLLGTTRFDFVGMGGAAASLPAEAAVALSFRGNIAGVPEEEQQGLVRPASHRRGRIFFGPLVHAVVEQEANSGRNRVSLGFRDQLLDAYAVVAMPLWGAGPAPVRHIVYSRKSGATHPVVRLHVDDAFDTVRRRGERAVERTTRDVVQPAPGP